MCEMGPAVLPASRRTVSGLALACLLGCTAGAAWAAATPACDPDGPPERLAAAVREVQPSVVRVLSVRWRRLGDRGATSPSWDGRPPAAQEDDAPTWVAENAAASGFAIGDGSLVLTSAHAVEGTAETWVTGPGGARRAARILGADSRLDVAVLRVDGERFEPVRVGARPVRAGQWIGAIGAPFGLERSVTAGVVSAFPRELVGGDGVPLIQSDVPLNPGSSGGPLFNVCGELVGMNSLVFSAYGVYLGVSFSVPAERVLRAATAILRGRAPRAPQVHAQSLTPALRRAFGVPRAAGALLTDIRPGSAAARAGLQPGDVVLAAEGGAIEDADALMQLLASSSAEPLHLQVWRGTRLQPVVLAPGGREHRQEPAALRPGWPVQRLGLQLAARAKGAALNEPPGLRVLGVSGDGLLAGVEEGDRIFAVNEKDVADVAAFEAAVQAARARGATEVALLIEREGVPFYLAVPLRAVP